MAQKMKRWFTLVLSAAMVMNLMCEGVFAKAAQLTTPPAPAAEAISGASAEIDWTADEITLTARDDLLAFAKMTQSATDGETGTAGRSFAGQTIRLGTDIDLSDVYWYHRGADQQVLSDYRIGTFQGTFDGNGHTISNLRYLDTYENPDGDTTETMLAFFLDVDGYVKDLTIDGISVDTASRTRFAGLVGEYSWQLEGSCVSGCTVKNIEVNAKNRLVFGGMFWKVLGANNYSSVTEVWYPEISDCHVEGLSVTAYGALSGSGNGRCGGFFATGGEGGTLFDGCSVKDFTLYASGVINYVGGFAAGTSGATYQNCTVDGFTLKMLNAQKTHRCVGGFFGYTEGWGWGWPLVIKNCTASGLDISLGKTSTSTGVVGAGGFLGCFNNTTAGVTIENCSASGTITVSGKTSTGGFLGQACNPPKDVILRSCSTSVDVETQGYAGDFTGGYHDNIRYSGCTATGNVIGKKPDGIFRNSDSEDPAECGILSGTCSYDPSDNVADGYCALNNGDGTWTVFPGDTEKPRGIVTLTFQLWNEDTEAYESWRTIEVYAGAALKDSAFDNTRPVEKDGYRFDRGLTTIDDAVYQVMGQHVVGWYKVEDDTPFREETVIEKNTVVYARLGYYVTFDRNDGSDPVRVPVEAGSTVARPDDPSRAYYVFLGWNLNGQRYDFGEPVNQDITLVAAWMPRPISSVERMEKGTEIPRYLNTVDHDVYLNGFGDGTIRPCDSLTRGQLATILFRLLDEETRDRFWTERNGYTDCGPELWCCTAVSTLSELGIFDGYEDGTFRPDEKLTRAQFAKIAVSFFDAAMAEYTGIYTDVSAETWYAPFVEAAARMELIQGYEDGTFRPEEHITRAQACVILNRMLGRIPHKEHLLPAELLNTYTDCSADMWFYADVMEASNGHAYTWSFDAQTGKNIEVWTARQADCR